MTAHQHHKQCGLQKWLGAQHYLYPGRLCQANGVLKIYCSLHVTYVLSVKSVLDWPYLGSAGTEAGSYEKCSFCWLKRHILEGR